MVDRIIQARPGPEAATLIGRGKVEELQAAIRSGAADVIVFDHDLSPTQQRNLEKATGAKVVDRTQVILDIFALRARTREGRLQIELAQLSYLLPRLTGHGAEMSRLGGGIGTRGPGETRLETDRRRIARRIKKIEDDLEGVRAGRALHRKRRGAVPLATLALAGYTNAGKSTLFNRLTRADVLTDARMFATLDPTVRPLTLPSRRRVLLSDTVGFIRNLPTTLVKAFRATLEEVREASLVLHVVDVSSPAAADYVRHVTKVLHEIQAAGIPQILVMNKIDRLPPGEADLPALRFRLLGGGSFGNPRGGCFGARRRRHRQPVADHGRCPSARPRGAHHAPLSRRGRRHTGPAARVRPGSAREIRRRPLRGGSRSAGIGAAPAESPGLESTASVENSVGKRILEIVKVP